MSRAMNSKKRAADLKPGEVLLLENVRFHPGEQAGDVELAKQYRSLADVYSTTRSAPAIAKMSRCLPRPVSSQARSDQSVFWSRRNCRSSANCLIIPRSRWLPSWVVPRYLTRLALSKPLLKRVDKLCIGGAMTYTFRKALGQSVGGSKVEADKLIRGAHLEARG